MNYHRDTGRIRSGSVISRNPTALQLNNNAGLLVTGTAGKSIALCDILVGPQGGTGSFKLSTEAGASPSSASLISYVRGGETTNFKRPMIVSKGDSVYINTTAPYISVTYYEIEGRVMANASSSATTTSTTTTSSGHQGTTTTTNAP
jgi:hypothetical protein